MRYNGPILPLTVSNSADDITVSRNINFNFENFVTDQKIDGGKTVNPLDIQVTDSYTLFNNSENDTSIKILYPFIGSFSELRQMIPVLTLNNTLINSIVLPGLYTGNFTGSGPDDVSTLNLNHFSSWEEYATLLYNGAYLRQALKDIPKQNQNVVIYEFSNAWADHEKATAATIAVSYNCDHNNTKIMTYGFNGISNENGNGTMPHIGDGNMRNSFFIPHEDARVYGRSFYMIVTGEDIDNINIQGYINGSCNKGDEFDEASVDMVRYESTLDDIFRLLLNNYLLYDSNYVINTEGFASDNIDFSVLYKAAVEYFIEYGLLSEKCADRYQFGNLDDLFMDVFVMNRIFYLSANINIPSGRNISLVAVMLKNGSYDFYGTGSENIGTYGYDMLTKTDSILTFENITAEVVGIDNIEIVRQNFGFDPQNDILCVTLDPDITHYYIEVKISDIT